MCLIVLHIFQYNRCTMAEIPMDIPNPFITDLQESHDLGDCVVNDCAEADMMGNETMTQ